MTKRYKKEFTDPEIDSMVQEFRRGVKEEHPDENEEVFPNNAEQLRDYILTLEENMKHNPTEHLREELRVYKAHQTGIYKGFCFAYEQVMSQADKVKEEHSIDPKTSDEFEEALDDIKPTLFDGGPMFKDEEEFQKMKKVLADDPDTPKGHWVEDGQMKTYMFDKPKKKKTKKGN